MNMFERIDRLIEWWWGQPLAWENLCFAEQSEIYDLVQREEQSMVPIDNKYGFTVVRNPPKMFWYRSRLGMWKEGDYNGDDY